MPIVADAVHHNARIYTLEPDQPWASVLLLRDGLVVAVGDEELLDQVGGTPEVVDHDGAFLPAIAWNDSDAREQLVDALVGDAHRLLGHLPEQELEPAAAEAVGLLALVAGQDVEPAEGSDGTDGRWRIARKVAPERVISTVDPQTRHAHKTRAHHQDGYKAHVKVEPDTGLITGCALTPASGPEHSDAAVGIELLADEPDPVEVLGESAYGTGELLAAVADGGHTAIIKPWPLRPAVDGGFTLDEFTVDATADTVTCPNRADRPDHPHPHGGLRCTLPGLPAAGPLHHLGRRQDAAAASAPSAAARAPGPRRDPEFQAVYRQHRPMVERSISWLVAGGNRRLRFVGTRLNDLWLHHRVAALNLRRLLTLGLIRSGGTWTLAPA